MKQQNWKIKGKGAGPEKARPFWFWEILISPLRSKNLGEINRKLGFCPFISTHGLLNTYYDQDNRAIKVTYPDESTTSTVYNGQGAVTESVDENGHATSNCYDQAGRRIKTVAGYNSLIPMETDYTYDNNGNQTMLTVAGTLQSTTEYDALNRAATVLYPQPGGQAMVMPSVTLYDADGRKTGQIDQAGNMTSYSYDGQARLTSVTDAMGHATRYTYDQLGNELTQTDANGHVTSYTYDVMNRRKSRILPGGQQETYDSYDATGNLTHKTTFDDKGIGYSYTPLDDKLQTETFNEGSINFSYDGFLRRYSMTDVSGTTTYNYDERDRLVAKNNPTYGNLTYTYDAHGNLTNTVSSNTNGTNVAYQYDALNRPATVVDSHRSQDLTTIYNYDSFGNLANVTKPNGEAVTYNYDVLNRLNSMSASLTSNSSLLTSYSYTLGPSGNRTSLMEMNGRGVTWTYDSLYRLGSETISNDPVVLNNGTIGYSYDPVGNRLERASNVNVSKIPAQNFNGQYDANDRLGGTNTYDNDGNTLSDGNNTYQYDTLDRLITVTSDDSAVSYVYDGDGNKVQETVNGLTRSFLVDSNNLTGYSQILEVNQGSGINKVYTYGLNRISEDQIVSNNWQLDFYGYDGQGSVRYMTDINGNLANTYEYDAFGTTLWQNGPVPNVMLYDGEERSQSSGLYDLRARWMNPGIGRFQTMDSYEGDETIPFSLHKYLFTSDDPEDRRDPGGNQDSIYAVGSEEITENFNLPTGISDGPGQGVFVQGHIVVGVFHSQISHLYLKIVPDHQSYWRQNFSNFTTRDQFGNYFTTLGAGPSSRLFGILVSSYNRTDDIFDPIDFKIKLSVPSLQQDAFIQNIIGINSSYNQNAIYDLLGKISYNSNSFVSGLFDALGVAKPNSITNQEFPGWNHPLPLGGQ